MQGKLNEIQARLEKDPKDEAAQKELQSVYMASQQRMQAEQQNVVNVLYDAVQRTVNAYREQKGYDVILSTEGAASFNPKVDVTTALIEEVNKQKLDFKPVAAGAAIPESGEAPAATQDPARGTGESPDPGPGAAEQQAGQEQRQLRFLLNDLPGLAPHHCGARPFL